MSQQIWINLPVKDVKRSIDFFDKLGYKFDERFTDENTTCMIISENIFVMLLNEDRFKDFTKKPIADAFSSTEVLLALSVDDRESVDALVNKANDAGAKTPIDKQDHGFMYQWGFEDLDGHQWEVFWMDSSAY